MVMPDQQDWSLLLAKPPMVEGVFGTFVGIPIGPSMLRPLKAYSGQQQKLAVSQLPFAESVTDLIVEYCYAPNDHVLVFSTPLHYIFEVWALWADACEIDVTELQDYKIRYLGGWDYKYLTSLLCIPGRYDVSMTSDWFELLVENKDLAWEFRCFTRVSFKRFWPNSIDVYIWGVVNNAYSHGMRMGKWHYGGNLAIPLYDALSLV